MRLPSVSPPDWKDLMRGMSNMSDGGEDFMNAEDYLNPQEMNLSRGSHLAGVSLLPLSIAFVHFYCARVSESSQVRSTSK